MPSAETDRSSTPHFEDFALPEFEGEIASARRPTNLKEAVARLIDPASATDTLHWGRNYLYGTTLDTPGGEVSIVVKQFRHHGWGSRLRRRWFGSKARKSWRAAQELQRAGVKTPEPLLLIESKRSDGPAFFVTRRLEDAVEARYFFRAHNAGQTDEHFPDVDARAVFQALGDSLRRLHQAGIWHRDVSVGNLLLVNLDAADELLVYFVDLNRCRLIGNSLGLHRRTKDLSRLPIFDELARQAFLGAYWGIAPGPRSARRLLYRLYQWAFLAKIECKKLVRRPLSGAQRWLVPRSMHAHIPAPAPDASARDRVVWDHLSDQPHHHAGRWEKAKIRIGDAPSHVAALWSAAAAAPKIRRRYRELMRDLYREPRPFSGLGIAVRPCVGQEEEQLQALEDLGVRRVLLRLHPWESEHRAEAVLAEELHRRGYELAFALPQNRDLVKDSKRWRSAMEEIGATFRPFGRHFQIGQAINRSKWGVWTYSEYLDLAAAAREVLCRQSNVEILGPATIDFEYHATAAVLNMKHEGVRFDATSALLYVDRRGCPESRQLGFDTVGKAVLLRAIAETSRNSGDGCWITEFNWPLWEGPHSPAGRDVSVDEETQADYLVRYLLLVLGTGLIERAYWWRLVARGYGLIELDGQGSLRRRPSFQALATLARLLEGTMFLGPMAVEAPGHLYRFRRPDGAEVVVGWSSGKSVRRTLSAFSAPPVEIIDRDGRRNSFALAQDVELTSAPQYFVFGAG